jgi:hypothetical protein
MISLIKCCSSYNNQFAQATAAKESTEGDSPDCGMEGIGEIEDPAKSQQMFYGDRSTKWLLVYATLLVSRDASETDPVIIAIPGCMIDNVP